MSYEVVVQLRSASAERLIGNRETRYRAFRAVAEAGSKYPQVLEFELFGEKCDWLKTVHSGDDVRVTFDLRGREVRGNDGKKRVWMSLAVVRMEKLVAAETREATSTAEIEQEEELPF